MVACVYYSGFLTRKHVFIIVRLLTRKHVFIIAGLLTRKRVLIIVGFLNRYCIKINKLLVFYII